MSVVNQHTGLGIVVIKQKCVDSCIGCQVNKKCDCPEGYGVRYEGACCNPSGCCLSEEGVASLPHVIPNQSVVEGVPVCQYVNGVVGWWRAEASVGMPDVKVLR